MAEWLFDLTNNPAKEGLLEMLYPAFAKSRSVSVGDHVIITVMAVDNSTFKVFRLLCEGNGWKRID
jgi:hypothetical protein